MKYVLTIICALLITNGFAQKRKETQTQLQVAQKAMIKADSIAAAPMQMTLPIEAR